MRIACPTCNAAYEVPDRLIAPGRRLRCARCGHDWAVQPAAPAEDEMPSAVPPTFLDELPRDPPPYPALRPAPQVIDPALPLGEEAAAAPRYAIGLWAAWAGSILVVLLFVAAVLVFRVEIAAVWPPAARLYTALGLNSGG